MYIHTRVHACIDAYKRPSGGTWTERGQDQVEHTDELKTIKEEGRRAKNNHGNTCELSQKKESSLMELQLDDIEDQEKEKTNEMWWTEPCLGTNNEHRTALDCP